ncbi:uncharacterized protein N7506_001258 [Penicillium brevicompactum]|uniref:uncharacterized protein n=1 Tax=Penicillium brevicompactum TaxID=5074 RepID=UPI00253FD2EE|nr:uncharacterized protein N7506_001258 [Penicillium brevicompactum]KAJ5348005.1 hypothetical protein N7506_001258 [Penicillium brevicompactum]
MRLPGTSSGILSHVPLLQFLFASIVIGYDPNQIDSSAKNAGPLTTIYTPPASCATPRTVANYGYPSLLQGCEGPYGGECCPEGWRYDAYFSPGRCPHAFKTCTLSTTAQRMETTAYCCPDGFTCGGQGYCKISFNTVSTMTYVDATLSTQKAIYGITASPIQIRFKAAESTIVPVPTDSLDLPRHFLYRNEKIGVGIGVPAGVALLTLIAFFGLRWRKARRLRREPGAQDTSPDDLPPPYAGDENDSMSRMERLRGSTKRSP